MKKLGILLSIVFILFIYHAWFSFGLTSSGDSGFYYPSVFAERIRFLFAWMPERGSGMGGVYYPLLWSGLDVALPLFLLGNIMHNWSLVEKFAYYYPFLLLGFFSSIFLFQKIFPKNRFTFLVPIIFLCNTYILMIVGGGQLLIGLSYALAPLILWQATHLIQQVISQKTIVEKKYFFSLLLGLSFSLQVLFDLRLVYITFVAIILYAVLILLFSKSIKQLFSILFFVFLFPMMIIGLLNAFWILPTSIMHQNPLEQLHIVSSSSIVEFFSFATFENTISLLHPNWPENIFGKITFMQPQFLVLPLFAYGSLLFLNKKNLKDQLSLFYFVLLGLLGSFFAKGSQEPFGFLYIWLFSHVPGFSLFRDPTKWYLLIVLSYMILIPYTVEKIYLKIKGER